MNFTLDDTAPQLVYSPSSWGIQSNADQKTAAFFQGTYHAAQVDGASVNMSISGSAVYLYGSKGPSHGNYSVQYDGAIIFLSAYADEDRYQQLLFQHTFDVSSSSPHFVSLTAHLSDTGTQGRWFDFDFVTITGSSNDTTSQAQPNTVVPPWQTDTTPSTGKPTATNIPSPAGNSLLGISNRTSSKASTILAVLFGCIIGLLLLFVLVYFLLRRHHDSKRAREHSFRRGQGPTRTQARWQVTNASQNSLGLGVDTLYGGAIEKPLPPPSPAFSGSSTSASASTEALHKERDASTPFSFLSTVPSLVMFEKRSKGDADSLKTDFLQV